MTGVNPYPMLAGGNEIHANNQTVSMFRASPWVTYDPTTSQTQRSSSHEMDEDVDMDAPQISTLREEETPPPQPKSTSARRGKAVHKLPPAWPRTRKKESHTDEEYDEVEEEEDQLIDDDDDELMKPVPPTALPSAGRSTDTSSKRSKTASKRKPRKSEKRMAEDERKAQEKAMSSNTGTLSLAPTLTWFEATPSENQEEAGATDRPTTVGGGSESSKATASSKAPRKPAPSRAKKPSTKLKTALPILADDTGLVSEGYTGTAASSPVTVQFEANSPEPEPTDSLVSAPPTEETNLEGVPLPVYPLPTKPFPVQPPPKIATGFAPPLPLDKSRKKVRHWRVANREIRGIAGGRWFARSWVGEKDSEYATGAKNGDKLSGVSLPRLSAVSISAPVGRGSGKGKSAGTSLTASAAPSRSGSTKPNPPPTTKMPPWLPEHAKPDGPPVRQPTKMRTIIAPPSEGGDSDMAAPPDS